MGKNPAILKHFVVYVTRVPIAIVLANKESEKCITHTRIVNLGMLISACASPPGISSLVATRAPIQGTGVAQPGGGGGDQS